MPEHNDQTRLGETLKVSGREHVVVNDHRAPRGTLDVPQSGLVIVYEDEHGEWRWQLKRKGRITADSGESYTRARDAVRAAHGAFHGLYRTVEVEPVAKAPKTAQKRSEPDSGPSEGVEVGDGELKPSSEPVADDQVGVAE